MNIYGPMKEYQDCATLFSDAKITSVMSKDDKTARKIAMVNAAGRITAYAAMIIAAAGCVISAVVGAPILLPIAFVVAAVTMHECYQLTKTISEDVFDGIKENRKSFSPRFERELAARESREERSVIIAVFLTKDTYLLRHIRVEQLETAVYTLANILS